MARDPKWIIAGNDVGKPLKHFQVRMANELNSREVRVEEDTHAILALSNIILVKIWQGSQEFRSSFPDNILRRMEEEVKKKFNLASITESFKMKKEAEKIIEEMLCGKSSSYQAARKLSHLTSDNPLPSATDKLLLGLRNLVENMPKKRNNETARESNISCSYVHSTLNPMFTCPDKAEHLIWSNIQELKEMKLQPDFVAKSFNGPYFSGPTLIGEVKGEDRKGDAHDCLIDLMKIGLLSGRSINQHNYHGIIGVHVVGPQVTFYLTTLMEKGVYMMMEICSIQMPRDSTQLVPFVSTMSDLLPVISYSEIISSNSLEEHCYQDQKKPMLEEEQFLELINCSKSSKRLCTIRFNH